MASSREPQLDAPRSLARRMWAHSALLAAPALICVAWLLWRRSGWLEWSLLASLLIYLWAVAASLADSVERPLRTLANVVSAMREQDYSLRARGAGGDGVLGELAAEINALADMLQQQRTQTMEASALLAKIVEVMDAPLFTFDRERRLRLINPAGERLLARSAAQALGSTAEELSLAAALSAREESVLSLDAAAGKWMLRRTSFRQEGAPHTLVVLSDVSAPLQEEERLAWQRLIRVLGHELSNSLAPIKSIAESLASRLAALPLPAELADDSVRGLRIVGSRADALLRFVQAYRRLAQLPPPQRRMVELAPLVERVAALTQGDVAIIASPALTLEADPDQLEHMLINLAKNAVEASQLQGSARVKIRWGIDAGRLRLFVDDFGPGISNPDNLFVPFYTTKPEGSGVGLALARQIAHAHGGSLRLFTRTDAAGARAELTLPLAQE